MSNIQTYAQQQNIKLQRLHQIITKKQAQIERALPQGALTAERMTRIVLTSISMNKALWNCTETSLLAAVMQAAQLGLEPDGALGMASLVPYGDRCQLVIGYRGYIQLALRSGFITDIRTRIVNQDDVFEVEYGLDEKVTHKPSRKAHERARSVARLAGSSQVDSPEPVAVYGVAEFTNGGKHFEVLYAEDVHKIRECSKGWRNASSPWQQWTEAMWRKTAVKQTLKYCPMAAEDANWVRRANTADERIFADISVAEDGNLDGESGNTTVPVPAEQPPHYSEPHVVSEGATQEQIEASDNQVIKDAVEDGKKNGAPRRRSRAKKTQSKPKGASKSSKLDQHVAENAEAATPANTDSVTQQDDRQLPLYEDTGESDVQSGPGDEEGTSETPEEGAQQSAPVKPQFGRRAK